MLKTTRYFDNFASRKHPEVDRNFYKRQQRGEEPT